MSDAAADQSRYQRQRLLQAVGAEGQARIRAGHVLIVGCGALGCTAADLLVRAGVGRVDLIDRDTVDLTNLHRQTLFDEEDAYERLPKAEAARQRLQRVNSSVRIEAHVADFGPDSAERLAHDAAVIVDGTDNFQTRYLVNDLAVKHALPWVYGGAVGLEGRVAAFVPGGACLRCVFDEPPAPGSAAASRTCDTVGVLGPLTALIGSMQAAEALRLLVNGPGDVTDDARVMWRVSLWPAEWRSVRLGGRRADCPCCARRSFEFLDGSRGGGPVSLCGRGAVQVAPGGTTRIDLDAAARRLQAHGVFAASRWMLRGELSEEAAETRPGAVELTLFHDGRAIIEGTVSPLRARAIYDRYVGS